MAILFKNAITLEVKIHHYLDNVTNSGILFREGIEDYLNGDTTQFNNKLADIRKNEEGADALALFPQHVLGDLVQQRVVAPHGLAEVGPERVEVVRDRHADVVQSGGKRAVVREDAVGFRGRGLLRGGGTVRDERGRVGHLRFQSWLKGCSAPYGPGVERFGKRWFVQIKNAPTGGTVGGESRRVRRALVRRYLNLNGALREGRFHCCFR